MGDAQVGKQFAVGGVERAALHVKTAAIHAFRELLGLGGESGNLVHIAKRARLHATSTKAEKLSTGSLSVVSMMMRLRVR